MAVSKAIGLSSAAAAIATASIVYSASSSPSSVSSSRPPVQHPNLRSDHRGQEFSLPVHRGSFSIKNNSLVHTSVGKAMAVSGATTEEKASAKETITENLPEDQGAALPDFVTEFMVDMKCEGCVSSVRKRLEPLEGVKKIDVDLPNQVVRVQGSASLKALNTALEQTGRKARLIGQGSPNDFLISASVAEFKGPELYGVVRFAQVSMELARVEASFSGLMEGPHGWSINEYGDLTRGAASTGGIYNPKTSNFSPDVPHNKPFGDLGTLVANRNGEAEYSGSKTMLKVGDLIGRALVVYATEHKSEPGIAAAVIARSAGVGENYKKLCTCDGTVIWNATNDDFVKL